MAGVELVLIKPLLLSYVNHVVVMLNSIFKKIISIKKEGDLYQDQPQPNVHSKAKILSPQQ